MTEINDRRTAEERASHRFLVIATDRFMSGWGRAEGGSSVCVWACASEEDRRTVWDHVSRRPEMERLRSNYDGEGRAAYRLSRRGVAHVSVYVVEPGAKLFGGR
jgi:hypothetical protein